MDKTKSYRFDTQAIHGGNANKNPKNALNAPIFMSSTFEFQDLDHAEEVFSFKKDDFVYTRGNNPTLRLFEEKMAVLEKGVDAVAFASGMAAISSVLFSLLKPGCQVIANKTIYGSSYNIITKILPQYGISYKFVNLADQHSLPEALDETTTVIYFETPSNPNLDIIDILSVSKIAHEYGIKVVVDNTFATPYFQTPLTLGTDVVVHSATKYISGHGDAIGGIAVSRDASYLQELKFDYMSEFGGVMSPFNAWLLLRGLKTLGVRMRQHQANAMAVASYLYQHPRVERVLYPGLPTFKGHETAKRQMTGFGGMLSFEVKGGLPASRKVVNNLKLAKLAVSLGDAETLVEHPAVMTHRGYPREELEDFGLTESMIRMSIGLEDSTDIIHDLEEALETSIVY
ncbi:MAG: aminotransferase class I/II-fold pyridoxal phosphate-dependent enzyme [Bacillota bacterium]